MAQSEKIFRDLLCERRSLPVETNDPSGAKAIDELKKQVRELKHEVESEKVKLRQANRDHERDLRRIREEAQRKLEVTVESTCVRKDLERLAEIKKLEEKLEKQRIQEVQALDKERAEELIKHQRKWQREKEEAIRLALEMERRKFSEETQNMYGRDEVHAREHKLAREVFILEERNNELEEQLHHLRTENKGQIELLRRMRHQYDNELEGVIKQHQSEAARDMAQLRLAEQLISERDQVLHTVEYKADMAVLEKEALEEELLAMKSERNTSVVSNASAGGGSPPPSSRKSIGTPGGLLQKRVDDLERSVRKLEEDKSSLKQENASLRKKLYQETTGFGSGGEGSGGKVNEEKAKTLRKRNAELVALAKQLDERCKALKMENEQMQKQTTTSGDTEQQIRKSLARQHTKDIMEYTRQIASKDREISDLKRKLAKFEVITPTRPEPCPELEKKMRANAMEKLRMEKLVSKLYSKLPDMVEVGVSHRELETESQHSSKLEEENKKLRRELDELHQAATQGEEVDYQQERESQESKAKQLEADNTRLKDRLAVVEKEHASLKESSEQSKSELEQRCHELNRKLEVSQLAVKELESNAEQCSLLERQVELLTTQLTSSDSKVSQLEKECEGQRSMVESLEKESDTFKAQLREMENELSEKETEYNRLQKSLVDLQSSPPSPKPQVTNVCLQTDPIQRTEPQSDTHTMKEEKTDAASKNDSKPPPPCHDEDGAKWASPRTSTVSGVSMTREGETSLENEMKAMGIEVTDSFDSSEGVGFSEVNLEDSSLSLDQAHTSGEAPQLPISNEQNTNIPQQSTHEKTPLQLETLDTEREVIQPQPLIQSADSAVPIVTLVDAELSSEVANVPAEDLVSATPPTHNLSSSEDVEDDLSPSSSKDSVEEVPPVEQQEEKEDSKVAVFIAKFTYKPSEMSPNPSFDMELPLTAGDYLYVYGDMDADGFYHGQLMNGESGLVPSNFIERVMDDDEHSPQPPRKPQRRRLSNLQDIAEEDEEVSSGDSLPPPSGLEMDRQMVDDMGYSIAMHWDKPHPLPAQVTGYAVYINGNLAESVNRADHTSLLLKGVPRKQLVKISVRTVTEEGESPDPKQLIILNPQYPQPPTELELTQKDDPISLLVTWKPSEVLEGGNTITGYAVYINSHCCVKLASHPSPVERVCTQLLPGDVQHFRPQLDTDTRLSLTVRALSNDYESVDSSALLVSKEQISHLLKSSVFVGGEHDESSSSSQTSIMSSEEEREVYSPAKKIMELEQQEQQQQQSESVDHVSEGQGHVTTSKDHVINGNPDSFTEDTDSEGAVPVHYYRALYSYDPTYQSPNEVDEIEEELAFQEGDIITVKGGADEDGYLQGQLDGRTGFIPGNMVEEITDPDDIAQVKVTLSAHAKRRTRRNQKTVNGHGKESGSSKKMRALFDYDPERDSPNESSEVELTFTEGDILTVFGSPDEDGFYKAELSGKTGLVPYNFLKEMSADIEDQNEDEDDEISNEGVEVFAADEESMQRAQQILNNADSNSADSKKKNKKRKGVLSQGREIISKSLARKGN